MKYIKFIILLLFITISSIVVYAKPSDCDIAIERAKEAFYATANGDVAKLKRLLTPEFYKKYYPYSDAKVKEILLSVPIEKRKRMIDQIKNNSIYSAFINRAGDVITVTITNKSTKKEITFQLIDEKENGDWKVCNYWK